MTRWIGALFLLLVLAHPATAADKTRLTVGISQYPATLSPIFETMLAKTYVLGMTRRPITAYNAEWAEICMMCTELPSYEAGTVVNETTADGKPGLAVTFTLLADAVWGDGTPITTADVAFTIEVGQTPETGTISTELFRRIDRLEVLDDKRFTLHLNKRTCDFAGLSGLPLLPAHLERKIFLDSPKDYRKRSLYDTDSTQPGLWFGPYRVARVTSGQSILLERNPLWWGAKPQFDEVLIRTIENTAAITANLLSGDIDMIAGELGITIDQAFTFEKRNGDRFQVLYRSGLGYEHIDVNFSNPALQDERVRQALLQGIDREAISQQLFQGKQPVAHGNVNPLDKYYDPDLTHYSFNPEAARQLLDDAGWLAGPDGIRMKDGEKLSFAFQTTADNKTRELVQQVIQNQWRAIGIDARIENEQARIFFADTVSKRKFQGLAMYAWLSAPESVPRTTLHSKEIPSEANGWAGQNYPGYANPDMDRILDHLETDCSDEEQKTLWTDLQKLYLADLPVLPLYFRANAYLLPKGMTGIEPTGHQFPTSLWVENWRLNDSD